MNKLIGLLVVCFISLACSSSTGAAYPQADAAPDLETTANVQESGWAAPLPTPASDLHGHLGYWTNEEDVAMPDIYVPAVCGLLNPGFMPLLQPSVLNASLGATETTTFEISILGEHGPAINGVFGIIVLDADSHDQIVMSGVRSVSGTEAQPFVDWLICEHNAGREHPFRARFIVPRHPFSPTARPPWMSVFVSMSGPLDPVIEVGHVFPMRPADLNSAPCGQIGRIQAAVCNEGVCETPGVSFVGRAWTPMIPGEDPVSPWVCSHQVRVALAL